MGRWPWLALALGLGLVALWWRRHPSPNAAPAAAPEVTDGPARSRRAAAAPAPPARSGPPPPARRPPRAPVAVAPPIIDEITVEKAEVCEGEENLVTVRAHTTDGNDPYLHYQVGPTRGARVALRAFLDDGGHPTVHRVSVFSRNNVLTSVEVPSYRVKKCDALPAAAIAWRLLPNTWADLELEARLVAAAPGRGPSAPSGAPFRPRLYRWTFGDDAAPVESAASHVIHSFAARRQDALYTSLLVTVEVLAEDGRVARARQSLELLNPAFEALAAKGIVQLMVELVPRFPVMAEDGRVEETVRLWHARPQPVPITEVTRIRRRRGASGGVGEAASVEHPAVASVLGASEVPPGRGLELRVVLDTRAEPEIAALDFYLEGATLDGYRARGTFSVMRPPPRPTPQASVPVRDPALVAKIQRARELLHSEYVTDEDLWSLERDGRFAGLEAEPASAPPAPAPPPANVPGR